MRRASAAIGAMLLASPAVSISPANSAMNFAQGLYRFLPEHAAEDPPYAPKLAALIARDRAYSRKAGEVGALDGVALCDCQDFSRRYRLTNLRARADEAGHATVFVTVSNDGLKRFRLDLVRARTAGGWLIADIHAPTTPSLLAHLARAVPRNEAALRSRTAKP